MKEFIGILTLQWIGALGGTKIATDLEENMMEITMKDIYIVYDYG